jgi:hypothetical protein
VQAAEEPLEERCLAHDHVDEVDAARALRVLAALDLDERSDGVRRVRQEDVVAGRQDPQHERDREQHAAGREQPARREDLHSNPRVMPPSTPTVVPLT